MTTRYVDSTATGTDDGTSWTNAYPTLVAALAASSSADLLLVEDGHVEVFGSSTTLVFPNDPGIQVVCVDEAAETVPKKGAVISTAGDFFIGFDGTAFIFGIAFKANTDVGSSTVPDINIGASSTIPHAFVFDNVDFTIGSTNAGATLDIAESGDSSRIHFIDCSLTFGAVTQEIIVRRGEALFRNFSIAGSTAPTSLFKGIGSQSHATVMVENSDISVNGPTNLLERVEGSGLHIIFRNNKLPGSVVLVTGSIDFWSADTVEVMNSDSADTNYRYAFDGPMGTIDTETTITRTGGAEHGGTQYSFKMVSSANALFGMPLESPEFVIWNETIGSSITVTVKTTVATTALQDDEIWLEIQYLGTSGFPKGSSITDRVALLGTPADQTVSAETWDSSPTSPQDQNLVVSFTPQEVGFIHCKVMLAKPSITVYVDPLPVVT